METNKKTPIQVYLTKEEHLFITSQSDKDAVSKTSYIRDLIKKKQRRVKND